MVAAIHHRRRDAGGSRGAAPVLLDTRAQVRGHGGIAASGRGEKSRKGARRDFRPRPNPWTPAAQKAAKRAQMAVARAFEDAGRDTAAARIELCGEPWVGYAPEELVPLAGGAVLVLGGEMLRSKAGVPTAILQRCGCQLCARGCAGDLARRRRRVIVERLEELRTRADPRRPSPMFMRQKSSAATVDEVLAAVAAHGAELADARRAAAWDEGDGITWNWDDDAEETGHIDVEVPPLELPTATKKKRRPRPPRRPRRDRSWESVAAVELVSLAGGAELVEHETTFAYETPKVPRRTLDSFRVSLPPSTHAYGCRQLTLTQPKRADGTLSEEIDRAADALTRFIRSAVFTAHVDAAVFRIEFELSTPARRRETARAEGHSDYVKRGTWWHVHIHGIVWGRFWPQSPSTLCKRDEQDECFCTRCSGVDDEDSLLIAWRRALVETKRYGDELDAMGLHQGELLRSIRWHSHRSRRTWAKPLLDVDFGGARIQIPARENHGRSLTPLEAVHECVKYATKTIELGRMPRHRVAEVVDALNGRRLMRCTGLLFGLHLPEDAVDEAPRNDVEGVDTGEGIGEHALAPDGRVVDTDEIVWRADPRALRERLTTWAALHETHEAWRRACATGPPPDAGGEAWTP